MTVEQAKMAQKNQSSWGQNKNAKSTTTACSIRTGQQYGKEQSTPHRKPGAENKQSDNSQ